MSANVTGWAMALPTAMVTQRHFGIAGVHREHVGGSDDSALVAGMVDDQLGTLGHFAQVLDGLRIGNAVPDGLTILLELLKGIDVGFGLEEIVHGGALPSAAMTPLGCLHSGS